MIKKTFEPDATDVLRKKIVLSHIFIILIPQKIQHTLVLCRYFS